MKCGSKNMKLRTLKFEQCETKKLKENANKKFAVQLNIKITKFSAVMKSVYFSKIAWK